MVGGACRKFLHGLFVGLAVKGEWLIGIEIGFNRHSQHIAGVDIHNHNASAVSGIVFGHCLVKIFFTDVLNIFVNGQLYRSAGSSLHHRFIVEGHIPAPGISRSHKLAWDTLKGGIVLILNTAQPLIVVADESEHGRSHISVRIIAFCGCFKTDDVAQLVFRNKGSDFFGRVVLDLGLNTLISRLLLSLRKHLFGVNL